MSSAPAIVAVVATLALGVAVGLLYLQRVRRPRLVTAHLVVGLVATALVAALVFSAPMRGPGGPPGFVPLSLLAMAAALGWFAPRLRGVGRRGAERMLAAHLVAGIAGFLALLAWAKTL